MSAPTYTQLTTTFVDESYAAVSRTYNISGSGDNQIIVDTTVYDTVPSGCTKTLTATILNAIRTNINGLLEGLINSNGPYIYLNTSASSGTDDYVIYQALVELD